MTPWPAELPLDDALTVLKAAARGDIEGIEGKVANVAWVALGYIGGKRYGSGHVVGSAPEIEPSEMPIDEGIAVLEDPHAEPGTVGAVGLDPITALRLAHLLYRIAKRFRLLP
jgi:hypothetical protein